MITYLELAFKKISDLEKSLKTMEKESYRLEYLNKSLILSNSQKDKLISEFNEKYIDSRNNPKLDEKKSDNKKKNENKINLSLSKKFSTSSAQLKKKSNQIDSAFSNISVTKESFYKLNFFSQL